MDNKIYVGYECHTDNNKTKEVLRNMKQRLSEEWEPKSIKFITIVSSLRALIQGMYDSPLHVTDEQKTSTIY